MQISNLYFIVFFTDIGYSKTHYLFSFEFLGESTFTEIANSIEQYQRRKMCWSIFLWPKKDEKKESEEKNNVKGQTLKIMYLFCNLLLYGTLFLFLKVRKRAS